jgi:hypothetical protein
MGVSRQLRGESKWVAGKDNGLAEEKGRWKQRDPEAERRDHVNIQGGRSKRRAGGGR